MKLNSIFLSHKKGTENSETIAMPLPARVKISMSQHMGAPCEPTVAKGDRVLVGQVIGESSAFMSCPVHSSVSGTVAAISELLTAGGKVCKMVEIDTDGEQEVSPDVKPPVITDKASLCEAVRQSGCCGMGGAGFPTHIKLNFDENKYKVDTLVINAAECEPYITSDYREMMVAKGDRVLVGQVIGESSAFMSCPVHSSVSGTVAAISELLTAGGKVCKMVEIDTDGEQEVSPDVKPPVITDKASLCEAVRQSGCCGMGGAGFPTHIKLNFDENKYKVDTLVINAAECEPYITSDYREMMENADDVMCGIKLVRDMLGLKKVVIGIEDNKPQAIKLMREKSADDESIEVKVLKSCYPQGAEKVIIFNATGRVVGEGQLPSDQGVIVMNVTTAGFIGEYSKTGMPLISKRITVDGDVVSTPCNVKVPIGTSAEDILKFGDCDKEKVRKALFGGPMMGMCLYELDTPVTKTTNAILAFGEKADKKKGIEDRCTQTNCIKCGRCISACPLNLMPTELEKAYDRRDKEALMKLKVGLCMNCGSCSYVCPAKRDLAEKNQLAKAFIRT